MVVTPALDACQSSLNGLTASLDGFFRPLVASSGPEHERARLSTGPPGLLNADARGSPMRGGRYAAQVPCSDAVAAAVTGGYGNRTKSFVQTRIVPQALTIYWSGVLPPRR